MAKVRESRQHRMVVVRHRPIFTWSLRVGSVVAIVAAGIAGYQHGFSSGAKRQAMLEASLEQQLNENGALHASARELEQQLINAKTGAEVDRKASEAVRQEVLELKAALQKAQEENNFYRNIMNPNDDKKGPTIGEWEVVASGNPDEYNFKLVVKQLANHNDWIKGHASIGIKGRINGETKAYNYKTLANTDGLETDEKDKALALKLRFRYFQTLTGTFTLPAGFAPESVVVNIHLDDKRYDTLTRSYDWLTY